MCQVHRVWSLYCIARRVYVPSRRVGECYDDRGGQSERWGSKTDPVGLTAEVSGSTGGGLLAECLGHLTLPFKVAAQVCLTQRLECLSSVSAEPSNIVVRTARRGTIWHASAVKGEDVQVRFDAMSSVRVAAVHIPLVDLMLTRAEVFDRLIKSEHWRSSMRPGVIEGRRLSDSAEAARVALVPVQGRIR